MEWMPCEPSGKVEMTSSLAAARVEATRRTSEFWAFFERKMLARSISLELAREWTSERGATNNYIESVYAKVSSIGCGACTRACRVETHLDACCCPLI